MRKTLMCIINLLILIAIVAVFGYLAGITYLLTWIWWYIVDIF